MSELSKGTSIFIPIVHTLQSIQYMSNQSSIFFAVGIDFKYISFRYWMSGLNYDKMTTSHDLTDFIISHNRLSRFASNLH